RQFARPASAANCFAFQRFTRGRVPRMQLKLRRFRLKRILLLLGGLAVVVAVVTALALQSPNRPGNGISAADAIQRAWEHSGPGAVTVRSAEIKRDFVTGFELPTHHWAWVVTFNGQWHLLC